MKHITLYIAISSAIIGCGGGSTESSSDSVVNPLAKYVGVYSACNGDHEYTTVINRLSGSDSLNVTSLTEYYDKSDCSGEIKGTETWSNGITATYRTTQVASVFGIVFMGERRSIDLVTANASNIKVSLTGPGVFNNCVAYTGRNYCLPSSTLSLQTNDLAAYMDDVKKEFVLLSKSGNDYVLVFNGKKMN